MPEAARRQAFAGDVQYTGVGSARFVSRAGSIKGRAVANFDERGRRIVRVEVESLDAEEPTFALTDFLSGRPIVRDGTTVGYPLTAEANVCDELVVEMTAGTLRASGEIHYNSTSPLFALGGQLEFSPIRAHVEFASGRSPKYWVLPLSNFVPNRWPRTTVLDEHPLRVSVDSQD